MFHSGDPVKVHPCDGIPISDSKVLKSGSPFCARKEPESVEKAKVKFSGINAQRYQSNSPHRSRFALKFELPA